MGALDGPRLRIRAATIDIDKICAAMNRACDLNRKGHLVEYDKTSRKDVHKVKLSAPADPYWPIHIGNILHNLRAALDGIVYEVILLGRKEPNNQTQFPIFVWRGNCDDKHNDSSFLGRGLQRQLAGVNPHFHAIFERHQPFGRERDPINLLKLLNDSDKHRLLSVVFMRTTSASSLLKWRIDENPAYFESLSDRITLNLPLVLEDDAVIGTFERPGGEDDPEGRVELDLMPEVSFKWRDWTLDSLPVAGTLRSILSKVVSVVEDFEVSVFGR